MPNSGICHSVYTKLLALDQRTLYFVVQQLITEVMGFVDMSEAVPGSAASVFSHGLIVVGAVRSGSAQ